MTDRPAPDPRAAAAPEGGGDLTAEWILDLTAEWILDALWLAVASYAGEEGEPGTPTGDIADEGPADGETTADQSRPGGSSGGPDDDQEGLASSGSVAVPLRLGGRALGQVPAREIGFGVPGPIRDPLALPRSLRRLRQVRRPGPRLEIDIDATVEATAEAAGRLVPKFTRRLERSLDLALVVDQAPSMRMWRETLDEFALLLGQTGAFRTVTRWTLIAAPGGVTVKDPRGTAHHPARLIDPSGRRLVFLATDATSQAWYESGLWHTLATWCSAMPVALIHMLPPDYWAATAVGGPPYLMGRATRPASPNAEYARRLGWWAADPGGEFLPVVPLTPRGLDGWARSAVSGTTWTAGVTTAGPDPGRVPAPVRSARPALEPTALIGEFKSRASPGAERLARVLSSATTLSAPLIFILQRRLAPQTDVPELAEVLASGLLEEIPAPEEPADPGSSSSPLLRFRPGVREILQRGSTAIDRWKAYDEVSKYLDHRQGTGGPLRAMVADPNGDATMNPADLPFAELKHTLAIRLGLVSAVPEQEGGPSDGHDAATTESVRAPGQDAPDTSAETEELLRAVLTAEIAALSDDRLLILVDFSETGASRWTISRDEAGTPQARKQAFREHEPLDDGSLITLVCSSPDNMAAWVALNRARAAARAPRVFICRASMPDVLTEAIAETPLTRQYGLVVLRTSTSGRLYLDSVPLFQPGDSRGHRATLRVRVESGGGRTAFAVRTARSNSTLIVSARSGIIPAGTYEVTALLDGPGRVNFAGLPAPVQPDSRPLAAIAAGVPERLDTPESAHLVCAVDVNNSGRDLQQRVHMVDLLITAAASAAPDLIVSIVSYGAHAFERKTADERPAFLQWEASARDAQVTLRELVERPQSRWYNRASQLECALAEIGERLSGSNTRRRTVLITIGSRPPHPPRVDLKTELLPCPLRRNWQLEVERIRRFVAAFGAINDARPNGEIWNYLGRDAHGFADSLDVPAFLTALGLRRAHQDVPFPLLADDTREVPEAEPAHTGDGGIVLLGPPASGKTTLLAALNLAVLQSDIPLRVWGNDSNSTQFLAESTSQLVREHAFPPATYAIERVQVTLNWTTTRTTGSRFRRRQESVPFKVEVTVADPPGEVFGSKHFDRPDRKTIIDILANSSGIIYLFDPTREAEHGDSYEYLYGLLIQLRRKLTDGGIFQGRLPHHLAVCVNKFDNPRILRSAQQLNLVTFDPNDQFAFPRVRGDDARRLFELLLEISPSDSASLLSNTIDTYFLPDRVRYFVTSSVGFHSDPRTGKFDSEDSENVARTPNDGVAIRGELHPIDVVEPFIWLAEQIVAEPPPAP